MTDTNVYARFSGGRIQHRLAEGTKTTLCGKDATLAHRYPVLTRANSGPMTDRFYRSCSKCAAIFAASAK